MTNTEMMRVILAHSEGKTIQYRYKPAEDNKWADCAKNQPSWDFRSHDYRVKAEKPAPREFEFEYNGPNAPAVTSTSRR